MIGFLSTIVLHCQLQELDEKVGGEINEQPGSLLVGIGVQRNTKHTNTHSSVAGDNPIFEPEHLAQLLVTNDIHAHKYAYFQTHKTQETRTHDHLSRHAEETP